MAEGNAEQIRKSLSPQIARMNVLTVGPGHVIITTLSGMT